MSFINHHFNINHCCNHGFGNWFAPFSNFSFFNFNMNFNFWGFRPNISPFGFNNFIPYQNSWSVFNPSFNNSWNNSAYVQPQQQNYSMDFTSTPSWSTFSAPVMDTFTRSTSLPAVNMTPIKTSVEAKKTTSSNSTEPEIKLDKHINKTVKYSNKSDINASINKDYLKNLTPEMQERTKKLIAYANEKGYDVEIVSGYRTQEKQKELQERYKNQPGRVAKNSAHCAGKAIDIRVTKNGKESEAGYKLLGKYAKKELDMRWGGDFKSFRENWHFDYEWA